MQPGTAFQLKKNQRPVVSCETTHHVGWCLPTCTTVSERKSGDSPTASNWFYSWAHLVLSNGVPPMFVSKTAPTVSHTLCRNKFSLSSLPSPFRRIYPSPSPPSLCCHCRLWVLILRLVVHIE